MTAEYVSHQSELISSNNSSQALIYNGYGWLLISSVWKGVYQEKVRITSEPEKLLLHWFIWNFHGKRPRLFRCRLHNELYDQWFPYWRLKDVLCTSFDAEDNNLVCSHTNARVLKSKDEICWFWHYLPMLFQLQCLWSTEWKTGKWQWMMSNCRYKRKWL